MPKRLRYVCNQMSANSATTTAYDDRLLHTAFSLDRLRMRTVLVTRMHVSPCSPARHAGMPTRVSTPSSLPDDVDADEVEEVRDDDDDDDDDDDAESLTVHCSWCSIILTSLEMSRTCDKLHCMRELCWRCMRSSDAVTREYVGRSCFGDALPSSSLTGVRRPSG